MKGYSTQYIRAQKMLTFDQCGAKDVYKGACQDVAKVLGEYFVFDRQDFQFLLNMQEKNVTIKVKISKVKGAKN